MAKFKVYELAKEVDKSSKEVVAFLQENGIEAKAAQSSVEEAAAEMVRKHFGAKASVEVPKKEEVASEAPKAEAPKKEEVSSEAPKAEAPKKKKNIVFVSNPQYSKMPGGQKPPMKNNNNNPKTNNKPVQEAKPAPKQIQLGPNQMINKSTGKVMEMLPPKKPEVVEKPQVAQEEKAPVKQNRDNRENRNGQDRPNNNQNRYNDRNNGERNNNDRNNERGNDRNFSKTQGDDRRTGDRNNAGKPGQRGNNQNFGDRPNNGNNKGSYQGNNNNKDGNRGFKDNERGQGRNERADNKFQSKKENKSFAADAPMMQNDKHREEQRRLNQAKDKRSKKDALYEEKEVEIKNKNKAGRFIKPEPKQVEPEETIKVITVPETITIKELAEKMKMQPAAIIKKLFMQGKIVTVNQEVSFEDAENIAIEFDIMCEQEVKVDVIEELLKEDEEAEENMTSRAPVICVMGHVDHGKTSLLDAIRKTNVTNKEAGGITQHIGAYSVSINGQKITFLDTPGHEAFTAMRMRGANATDIAILVVAADDGVKPQTIEAINHAKAAGIEIIVAVNKIDKPAANIERVKQELTEYELIAEDWGGSTIFAPVSAKTGEGIQELLEMILLTADILELKANPKRKARGLVIEAQLDKGRGPVATVLVQKGTLKIGDFISAGASHGKVRAMIDDKGRRVKEAGPSTPVEILGLNDVPNAGEVFLAHDNDKTAKQYAETFVAQNKEKKLEETKSKMSLDDLFSQIQEGNLKELNLIVK
ncbi:MAG: translation initiation factor IF-2, partial [Lachnospiraceae bacterium]|nr:translation initiation factor IF-2 [Lachnospiraceae bacterium]